MNERMENLMYRAGLTAQGCWDSMDDYDHRAIEKFAELIIMECCDCLNARAQQIGDVTTTVGTVGKIIKEHFGVKE